MRCGIGCGLLKKRYPNAKVIAIDQAEKMLDYAKHHQTEDINWLCADAEIIPLEDGSVDLIFMNLLLPWFDDSKKIFSELRRILRPEGLLMFSSLGPDTLIELRESLFDSVLPNLIDMHIIGDELTKARFADPVLDVEYLTVTYREFKKLIYELQVTGILTSDIPPDLNADDILKPDTEGKYPITFEIIYGHAWGPSSTVDHVADESGTVRIPLSHLRRR